MSFGSSAAAAAAAASAAANARAIKASGAIVRVSPGNFLRVLQNQQEPLIVCAANGFFRITSYQYLSSYKGLTFFTESEQPLNLPEGSEEIWAESIQIPE